VVTARKKRKEATTSQLAYPYCKIKNFTKHTDMRLILEVGIVVKSVLTELVVSSSSSKLK
jgi:hypothetical protein